MGVAPTLHLKMPGSAIDWAKANFRASLQRLSNPRKGRTSTPAPQKRLQIPPDHLSFCQRCEPWNLPVTLLKSSPQRQNGFLSGCKSFSSVEGTSLFLASGAQCRWRPSCCCAESFSVPAQTKAARGQQPCQWQLMARTAPKHCAS